MTHFGNICFSTWLISNRLLQSSNLLLKAHAHNTAIKLCTVYILHQRVQDGIKSPSLPPASITVWLMLLSFLRNLIVIFTCATIVLLIHEHFAIDFILTASILNTSRSSRECTKRERVITICYTRCADWVDSTSCICVTRGDGLFSPGMCYFYELR